MTEFLALVGRNCRLFFKDKGLFFTSLITPVILLVLYVTFLGNVYKDGFQSALPAGLSVSDQLINGCVSGQLISSLLAVCCVTVAFCSNMLVVGDKITGSVKDLTMTPVKRSTLALSYYTAAFISTLIVCFAALILGLLYLAKVGWYLSIGDVFLLVLDVVLLTMFGTALSSLVISPLKTDGQRSAVGTIVSAGYGFVCGAYMPISNFSEGLQKVLSFLPGTYGTVLLRNHMLRGVFEAMQTEGFPGEIVEAIKDSIDCNVYFSGNAVAVPVMYMVLGVTILVLLTLTVFFSVRSNKKG